LINNEITTYKNSGFQIYPTPCNQVSKTAIILCLSTLQVVPHPFQYHYVGSFIIW